MVDWINNRFGTTFTNADLENVKDFSLIWNIFERYVCNNNFTIATAEAQIKTKNFNLADFQPHLDYFKNRYGKNGNIDQRFANLNLRANDRGDLVKEVLLGNITTQHEVVLALIIIVYRYRNNMFHGLKDILFIDQQNENFRIANNFLSTLINYF